MNVRTRVMREIRAMHEAPRGCSCLEDVGAVGSQKVALVLVEPSAVDQQVAHLHHPLGAHEGHASRRLPHDTAPGHAWVRGRMGIEDSVEPDSLLPSHWSLDGRRYGINGLQMRRYGINGLRMRCIPIPATVFITIFTSMLVRCAPGARHDATPAPRPPRG